MSTNNDATQPAETTCADTLRAIYAAATRAMMDRPLMEPGWAALPLIAQEADACLGLIKDHQEQTHD